MKVKEIVIELMVKDVDASVHFYNEVLGFKLLASEEDNGRKYWAKLNLHDFHISMKEESRIKNEVPFLKDREIGGTTALCFQVDNLEEYHERVNNKCILLDHPHITPCGSMQFSMKDNNGYILTFERFK